MKKEVSEAVMYMVYMDILEKIRIFISKNIPQFSIDVSPDVHINDVYELISKIGDANIAILKIEYAGEEIRQETIPNIKPINTRIIVSNYIK